MMTQEGTTLLLLYFPSEQARGSWNSQGAWIVISVGRDPTLGSSLRLTSSHCGWTLEKRPGRWLDPPGCRTGRTDAYSCSLDYWHLTTLSQRSSQQSAVSVDPRDR